MSLAALRRATQGRERRQNLHTDPNGEGGSWISAGTPVSTQQGVTPPTLDGLPAGVAKAINVVSDSTSDILYYVRSLDASKTYRLSFYVHLASATVALRLRCFDETAAAQIAQSATYSTVGAAFTRLNVSVAPANTGNHWFYLQQVGAGTADAWGAAGMIEEAASLRSYFDGDFAADCGWEGVADASVSYKPK